MAEHIWSRANREEGQLTGGMASVNGEYHDVGTSNYYLPVYSMGDDTNSELKMLLWFFDSRGGREYQPSGADVSVPDWVDEKVCTPLH